jgi:two-component system, probable response regulator PhcQ
MLTAYPNPTVIFVDDEPQARKYFPRLLDGYTRVLVAGSACEAKDIADAEGDRVGLLITDQRMPGESGSQLLAWMRVHHPLAVRILTTAYSDIDDAIAAVNDGEIFRYILKPWSERELPAIVNAALQHHVIQRERHLLLRERMSTLQHLVMLDRARTLAVLAAGLSNRLRNPLLALKTFLEQAPPAHGGTAVTAETSWEDLRHMAHAESEHALGIIERIMERATAHNQAFQCHVTLDAILAPALAWAAHGMPGRLELDLPEQMPDLVADQAALSALFVALLRLLGQSNPSGGVLRITAQTSEVWGRPGISIRIAGDAVDWDRCGLARLFGGISGRGTGSEPDLDLVAGYFIVFHHGGSLLLHADRPLGPAMEIALPLDPDSVVALPLQRDWLESIFAFPALTHA